MSEGGDALRPGGYLRAYGQTPHKQGWSADRAGGQCSGYSTGGLLPEAEAVPRLQHLRQFQHRGVEPRCSDRGRLE